MKKIGWAKTAALALGLSLTPAGVSANQDADFAKTAADVKGTVVGQAQARLQTDPGVIRDQTTTVSVDLNEQTVKCSAADYSALTLKVLVPALDALTVLNHRNTAEGAPCLAAGRCRDGMGPDVILRSGAGIEQIPVRVVLKKVVNVEGEVCRVSIVETVTTKIRGIPFFHERWQPVADRVVADCR